MRSKVRRRSGQPDDGDALAAGNVEIDRLSAWTPFRIVRYA